METQNMKEKVKTFEEYQARLRKLRIMERYWRDGFFRIKAPPLEKDEREDLLS